MKRNATLNKPAVRPGGPAACEGTAAKSGGPTGSRSDKKQRHPYTNATIARMTNLREGIDETAG